MKRALVELPIRSRLSWGLALASLLVWQGSDLAFATNREQTEILVGNTGAEECGQEDQVDDRAPQNINRYNPVTGEFLGVYRVEGLTFPVVFEPRGLDASDEITLLAVVREGYCPGDSSSILAISRLTGTTRLLVDGGDFEIGGAEDVVAGPNGEFYVSDRKTNTIFGFRLDAGNVAKKIFELALEVEPLGLALGPEGDGSLYVLTANSDVRKIRFPGGVEVFVAARAGGLDVDDSADLVFGPDGDLYVANPGRDNVLRYDGGSGAFRDEFIPSGSGQLDDPVGLAFGASGSTLFVTSRDTDSVLRFNAKNGKFKNALATPSLDDGFLDGPNYLALAITEIPPLTQLQPSDGSQVDVPALFSWEPLEHPRLAGYEVAFFDNDPAQGGLEFARERVANTFFVLDDKFLDRENLGEGDVVYWRAQAIGRAVGGEVELARSEAVVSFGFRIGTSGSGTLSVISGLVYSDLTQAALVGAQVAVTVNTEHVPKNSSGGLHVFTTKDKTGYVVIALNTDPYPIVIRSKRNEFGTEDLEIPREEARDGNDEGKNELPGMDIVMKPTRVETDGIGIYRGDGALFVLRDALSAGSADEDFSFGPGGNKAAPISGDWDNDGLDTVGVYFQRKREFRLRNEQGKETDRFRFGKRNEIPVAGDWNGNGRDTIGTYNPATKRFTLRNNNGEGDPAFSFKFGPKGQIPLVGDWDGDGRDGIGVYDKSKALFRIRNELSQGAEEKKFRFGPKKKGWLPLAGDWNMDGKDTVGVYNPKTREFKLKDINAKGRADHEFTFGPQADGTVPLAGDWDGR